MCIYLLLDCYTGKTIRIWIKDRLSTLAVVAHYDSFGAAPVKLHK